MKKFRLTQQGYDVVHWQQTYLIEAESLEEAKLLPPDVWVAETDGCSGGYDASDMDGEWPEDEWEEVGLNEEELT